MEGADESTDLWWLPSEDVFLYLFVSLKLRMGKRNKEGEGGERIWLILRLF